MAAEGTMQAAAPVLLHRDQRGEALWFNNDLLTVKPTGSETGAAFLLIEELARQGKLTPLHAHPDEAQSFWILEKEVLLFSTATSGLSAPARLPWSRPACPTRTSSPPTSRASSF